LFYTAASVAALVLASRHTLPIHGRMVDHPSLEVLRTVSTFCLVGLCATFARASIGGHIDVLLIGALNGVFAVIVSNTVPGRVPPETSQVILGAVFAAIGAMLGSALALGLRRQSPRHLG
jgi:hypothetical protein